jgi:hypothetical protein
MSAVGRKREATTLDDREASPGTINSSNTPMRI